MTKQVSNISILGVGWLGLPLAQALIGQGYSLKGSTTTAEKLPKLQDMGIKAFQLKLSPEAEGNNWEDFLNSDILIVDIPPQTRKADLPPDFHPQQIANLLAKVAKSCIQKIIYISATSIYPDVERIVTESEPINAQNTGNTALWKAEQAIQNDSKKEYIILRLGGLLGYDRIPGRYFASKKNLETGEVPVNYIHQDDAVGIISKLITSPHISNEIFNGVSPEHPPRKVIYKRNAEDIGFEAPTFVEKDPQDYKIVSAEKLEKVLEYHFKYPNPLDYRYSH